MTTAEGNKPQNKIRVPVRELAAAADPPEDLARGVSSRRRALAGIQEHVRLQSLRPQGWEHEVSVSLVVERETFCLEIFGRMDSLCQTGSGVIIEEIKTCARNPRDLSRSPSPAHLAQVKCYGYMTAVNRELEKVTLALTYARPADGETATWEKEFTTDTLAVFFNGLLSAYLAQLGTRRAWERIRNPSLQAIDFPYSGFRKGQRDLAESVYKIISNDRLLFARAPTGTGKTMATLYPAIKAMGLGHTDKIFYLTAKSPGRTVAQKAVKDLARSGARLRCVTITAKQKTCFTPDLPCDMDTCIYAKSYYTKLNRALKASGGCDFYDQAFIEETARKHEICPFEFSLDLSLISDIIICDLNYAFDPRVYLKRFFDRDQGRLTFLMDEAHNLPDRLRSMYSADLDRESVLGAQDILRDAVPALAKGLVDLQKEMVRLGRGNRFQALTDLPAPFMDALDAFADKAEIWLDSHQDAPLREQVLEIFYPVNGFLNLARHFGGHYRLFVQAPGGNDITIRLFCLDPAPIFSELIKRCASAVLFSATFFPFAYYQQVLFGDPASGPKPHFISLPSPFPRENFKLAVHTRIKTTYRMRGQFYRDVAKMIVHAAALRQGNTLVFFSSYAYMEAVLDLIDPEGLPGPIQIQSPSMDETRRREFLDNFTPGARITGFAVMGGIFGEGIDLEGDRLTTVMVVGVGLPQVNPEQEEIRAYYDAIFTGETGDGMDGFFIAYQMPGFSRVLQAVGRLIRNSTDRGLALLMDDRFVRPDYLSLFPAEWTGFDTISAPGHLAPILESFSGD
ncbi:MAG: ATP-dependent DNA helicase [Desulfobacter sp.]|nr:MAG: ATP-dependent DNA helicase [Desulfobacter sp.]